MDSSDKKALYIILAVVLMGVLIIVLLSGGLNESTKSLYEVEARDFDKKERTLTSSLAMVRQSIAKMPYLFTDTTPMWQPLLDTAQQKVAATRSHFENAAKMVEEDDDELSDKIMTEIKALKSERTYAQSVVNVIQKEIVSRTEFAANRAAHIRKASEAMTQLSPQGMAVTRAKVQKAMQDWPLKKQYLETELQDILGASDRAMPYWNRIRQENAKPVARINWPQLISDVGNLNTIALSAVGRHKTLLEACEQLYVSWEKILEDMEIEEGSDVLFYHKYKKVIIKTASADTSQVSHQTTSERVKVDKATFEKLKENLGMVVASKPLGKFDTEAERVPQPPGYAYMCPPSQGRNRYGEWRQDGSGGSFWSWYGQYAFMGMLMGGVSGRVFAPHYSDYRNHRSRGKTYYGSSGGSGLGRGGSAGAGLGGLLGGLMGSRSSGQRYGTAGSVTQKSYGNTSKYLKSDGFSRSKYVRSGGSYRGSRYSSSGGGYRSRSSSRSSGYSFGRSSSGYRSSSFGSSSSFGGGK